MVGVKEKPDTYCFIALELLESPAWTVPHDVHHDLESFYWVLVWIVLRYTSFEHALGEDACSEVFKHGNDNDAASAKLMWLRKPTITVNEDTAMTELLAGFRRLMLSAAYAIEDMRHPLTYQDVIDIFDAALARDDSPAHNEAGTYSLLPPPISSLTANTPHNRGKKRRFGSCEEVEDSLRVSGAQSWPIRSHNGIDGKAPTATAPTAPHASRGGASSRGHRGGASKLASRAAPLLGAEV